MKSKMQKMIK